ncbi:MAG: winged helix-turn-helix domain-containing protein [Pyrobaculum sp.]|jgi:DNA-binding transcriptional ArsR family regulator
MIELALGSPLRVKIIITLLKLGEVNATELANRLETNYAQLLSHIKILVKYGIVEERRIGRARLIKLSDAEYVVKLAKALAQLDEKIQIEA